MYEVFNHIDECGRMRQLPDYYESSKPGQHDTSCFSYLMSRTYFVELGIEMGFDRQESAKESIDEIFEGILIT